ncbi:hypothetical protein BC835DRAFT_1307363 [Cytidiella melzeri]|nr:hypothetical protein BC835DRAFT_1307363 [Cytidiella melzeri]
MRPYTFISAFLLLFATAVLPALSRPMTIPAEDSVMRRTLSPAERHELLVGKRAIPGECTGPIATWAPECFQPLPSSSSGPLARNAKRGMTPLSCTGGKPNKDLSNCRIATSPGSNSGDGPLTKAQVEKG